MVGFGGGSGGTVVFGPVGPKKRNANQVGAVEKAEVFFFREVFLFHFFASKVAPPKNRRGESKMPRLS